jgi:hypothetical protein
MTRAVIATVIEWHEEADKPDSDLTVLCWGSEGFFCGYWDDAMKSWIGCESGGSVSDVTHWSVPDLPVQDVGKEGLKP